jgi:hypothetical protein
MVPFLLERFRFRASLMRRYFSAACLMVGLVIFARSPVMAYASNVGQAYDALPGLHRVPLAETSDARLTAALSMGYGVTEARTGESSSHQRLSTIAAIGVAPIPRLQLAFSASARYDRHPSDAQGSDSGTVVDPRLAARWIEPLGQRFAAGVEVGAWFPGSEDAARTLRATSPHVALLGTFGAGPLTIGGRAGYRLDRSGSAAPEVAELRVGDRLALGLSDFDAALLGAGAAYRIERVQLFAEANAELLIGDGAPALLESPIGATLGGRYAIDDAWSLELLGEASFSTRPTLAAGEPLVPVQPRYAAFGGVRFRWPVSPPATVTPEPGPAPAPEPAPMPSSVELRVGIRWPAPADAQAAGVEPRATLEQGGKQLTARRDGGDLAFVDVAPGKATLTVVADGYDPTIRVIDVSVDARQRLELELRPSGPRAQIRGLVRSFGGQGLRARIRVEPLGVEAAADTAGFFEIDVPPGRYEVSIEAEGYRSQQKSVVVTKDGVVILNADLLKEP